MATTTRRRPINQILDALEKEGVPVKLPPKLWPEVAHVIHPDTMKGVVRILKSIDASTGKLDAARKRKRRPAKTAARRR
jgi:hypothetical protein